MSRFVPIALALVAGTAAAAHADWIVFTGGEAMETQGPWQVVRQQVRFHARSGTLVAAQLDDVDLVASRFLTAQSFDPTLKEFPTAPDLAIAWPGDAAEMGLSYADPIGNDSATIYADPYAAPYGDPYADLYADLYAPAFANWRPARLPRAVAAAAAVSRRPAPRQFPKPSTAQSASGSRTRQDGTYAAPSRRATPRPASPGR
jgi:hypothetical protein